ncbi:MAG: hypothetical protein KAQ68_06855 [Clostridiales bacterium]|nr:hypothetical protein [Clostridiales bacterium]
MQTIVQSNALSASADTYALKADVDCLIEYSQHLVAKDADDDEGHGYNEQGDSHGHTLFHVIIIA